MKHALKIAAIVTYFAVSLGVCSAQTAGETGVNPFNVLTTRLSATDLDKSEINGVIKDFALQLAQNDPEILNKIFNVTPANDSFLGKFIEDTNLKLKVFEAEDNDESASLGFSYSYVKNKKIPIDSKAVNISGFDLAFNAKGNVAFDREVNPNDFLDTKLNWAYFLSRGGVQDETSAETRDALKRLLPKLAGVEKFADLIKTSEWQEYKKIVGKHLSDQYYFDIGVDGGLESDQSFDTTQYTYGAKFGFVARGWGENSILGKMNVLDYVPALIRRYSGIDGEWLPRGSAFPALLMNVDRVEPDDDGPRAETGDNSDYARLKLEVSFKTLVSQWKTSPVYLEANFRYYQEFDASEQVKDADIDAFTYFVVSLRLPTNVYLSYSTGRLPLDDTDDQVYSIGLDYNF